MEKYIDSLTNLLVDYSTEIKPNDVVLVRMIGENDLFVAELVKKIRLKNANPIVLLEPDTLKQAIQKNITEDYAGFLFETYRPIYEKANVFINVICQNLPECDNLTFEEKKIFKELYYSPLQRIRMKCDRWIGLRIPSKNLAEELNMSYEHLCDYYHNISNVDYKKLEQKYSKLNQLLADACNVRIIAKDTELTFSKKGINSKPLFGKKNFPDGELATAPEKFSLNGRVKFNTSSYQMGHLFENVELVFENGKVVNFNCNNNEELKKILNIDEGASYVGEFAIGVNPQITQPTGIILFDEKIDSSFHIALGQAHTHADNGNKSVIHWDLVKIIKPEYGGGRIYFDDKLVFGNGEWLI